jgi:hypothetical protein
MKTGAKKKLEERREGNRHLPSQYPNQSEWNQDQEAPYLQAIARVQAGGTDYALTIENSAVVGDMLTTQLTGNENSLQRELR